MLRLILISRIDDPNLKASSLLVADLPALLALHDIGLCTLICLMPYFVTLKAKLSVTIKAIVLVAST